MKGQKKEEQAKDDEEEIYSDGFTDAFRDTLENPTVTIGRDCTQIKVYK